MKPFLGINMTGNKKNQEANGREFLVAKPSRAMQNALDRARGKAKDTDAAAKLPLPLRIIKVISGYGALLILMGTLRAVSKGTVDLAQAYENAPWLSWLCGIFGVIWLVISLAEMWKRRSVYGVAENVQVYSSLESVIRLAFGELGVPGDAKDVDILTFYYKEKPEGIKVCEKGMQLAPYSNPVFKVWTDGESLYLANLKGKYAFPLSAVTGIKTVKKHIRILEWNKEEAFTKDAYKPYKLTADNYGCIHAKWYHILEVERNGEIFGIYIPSYECPAFEALTGMQAQPLK